VAIEINKGIEPFDDVTDFTRGNKERQPWGKQKSTDDLHLGSEYDALAPAPPTEPTQQPGPPTPTPEPEKFTHKLANGTVLKASTVEELASQIEKSLQQQAPPAPPLDFEDKPVYEGYLFKRKELTLQEQADILNVMKENPQKAYRMLQEAETGATTERLLQALNETQMALRTQKETEAAAEFLGECEEFNPTAANGKKLAAYLKEKNKPITVRNLKVAFQQLVASGDKSLLYPTGAQPVIEDDSEEVPPPPVIVPSNTGRPEAPAAPTADAAKFAALPLDKQKAYFANLRRQA
jgi:hypothetical protein